MSRKKPKSVNVIIHNNSLFLLKAFRLYSHSFVAQIKKVHSGTRHYQTVRRFDGTRYRDLSSSDRVKLNNTNYQAY